MKEEQIVRLAVSLSATVLALSLGGCSLTIGTSRADSERTEGRTYD